MKKIYTLILLSVFATSGIMAQPILTGANTNGTVGQSFTLHTTTWTAPGSGGANQTWNFATLPNNGTSTFSWVAPSSTPYNSNFPGSTLAATSTGQDQYYSTNSSSYNTEGAYNISANYAIHYTDPEKLMQYPFTFNSTFNDNLYSAYTANTVNFVRAGTSSATADGYGTLILPYGSLSNVLRVHFQEDYQDTCIAFGIGVDYIGDYYFWYLPGTHYPVLEIATFTASGNPTQFASYLDQASLSVNDESLVLTDLNLFPNPAANISDLNFSVKKTSDVKLSVVNMEGQVIIDQPIETLTSGDHTYHIDLQNYASGIYMIRLEADGKAVTRKLIKE